MKISKKVLERLYWKEKKSLTEIAKIFKVHHEKIRRLMKKYGIPIRSRLEGILLKKKLKVGKKKLYELYWKKGMKLEDIGKTCKQFFRIHIVLLTQCTKLEERLKFH